MPVKFFVLGFPKSGTSTIHQAFREAGLRSAHWVVRDGFCGHLIYRDHRQGRNPLSSLSDYDVIAQPDICRPWEERDGEPLVYWPQLDFEIITAIEEHNPEIRFILNRRDVDSLINSISNWASLRNRIIRSDVPGLPQGSGRTDDELRAWIEGHYAACQDHFAGNPRYLEFDIADPTAHQRLEAFAGTELPWWGVANSRAERFPDRPDKVRAPQPAPR